jgi:predicted RNase H-like HicB family nuclease
MKTYVFKVVVEPDEGGYHAYCPALRHLGAVTQGSTQAEALTNINELREDGEPLPPASDETEIIDGARVAVTV